MTLPALTCSRATRGILPSMRSGGGKTGTLQV
jgi:hypothetical protein